MAEQRAIIGKPSVTSGDGIVGWSLGAEVPIPTADLFARLRENLIEADFSPGEAHAILVGLAHSWADPIVVRPAPEEGEQNADGS